LAVNQRPRDLQIILQFNLIVIALSQIERVFKVHGEGIIQEVGLTGRDERDLAQFNIIASMLTLVPSSIDGVEGFGITSKQEAIHEHTERPDI
jgi:hypothetical protein